MGNDPHRFFPVLFFRISRLVEERLREKLEKIGIHKGQGQVLGTLCRLGPLSQKKLALRLSVKPPTIAKMLKNMEAAGLIERRPDYRDGRVSLVSLTKAGENSAEKVLDFLEELEREITESIPGSNKEDAREFLLTIERLLGPEGRQPSSIRSPVAGLDTGFTAP